MTELASAVREAARQVIHDQHEMMRQAIKGLDADALNWDPGDETNSIAQMLAHALESERFLITSALDREMARDREAAFHLENASADDLLTLIDRTEREVDGLLAELTDQVLARDVSRTTSTGTRSRPGAGWLMQAIAHVREHVGQASLTRQFYEQRRA
jgi:uncharacterized damage-inducible protein DinB